MSDLAAMGVSVQRRFLTEAGDETGAATAEITELIFTLKKPSGIEASFSREGLGDRLLKIFKKEIQTGDGIFDEAVSIKTDTTDATTKFLEDMEARAIIERVITGGGAIEIDGAVVKIEMPGRQDADDEVLESFVRLVAR